VLFMLFAIYFFGARQFFITVSDRMVLIVFCWQSSNQVMVEKQEVLLLLLRICRLVSSYVCVKWFHYMDW
jgi:hypothetical protein